MPLLGTRGAATAQGFGMFSLMNNYWIGRLGDSSTDVGRSVAIDSSGNVYVAGNSNGSGSANMQIAKYSNSGVIQWQRSLGAASTTEAAYSVAADSSGNVYVCGQSTVSGNTAIQIAKYNTSGTLQWQRTLNRSSANEGGNGIATDSSGNVYICGYSDYDTATPDIYISKYNTSGTIQWQRRLGASSDEYGMSIAVDSGGNAYICGYTNVNGAFDFCIAKYSTSGTIQWQRTLGVGSSSFGYSVAVDSSSNVYVCGSTLVGGAADLQIAKYNTSGTIQWQRRLGGGSNDVGQSIAVDGSGNVYVCGYTTVSAEDFLIVKYNTSGTIQWQRRLGSSGNDRGYGIAVDNSNNFYVCGYSVVSGAEEFLFAKLPVDGASTGTYSVGGVSYTYASTSLTDAAGSLTSAASSLAEAAGALTDASSSFTSSTTTLTSSVTTI